MAKVIIIGGGWAGCAAAVTAHKAGAKVTLVERTDLLLGLGNVGGIMRNNGRYTGAEELRSLGARELIDLTDQAARHKNVDFPGHKHATLYDVNIIEPMVRNKLLAMGIEMLFTTRVVDVAMEGTTITKLLTAKEEWISGDVFIETTGSTGPMGNCLRYGNGCSMCILRCPSFGPRISISQRAGTEDILGQRSDGAYGAYSGACKLSKGSLSKEVADALEREGVVLLPIPEEDVNLEKLTFKVCQQYALEEFARNIVLLDTGYAKLMTSFYPLDKLRKINGLEYARYDDPYSGGIGNSIRYLSMAPSNHALKVDKISNLLCAGEKSGLFVGHTEAISTGSLAGYNSVRLYLGMPLLELPRTLAVGDLIAYAHEQAQCPIGRRNRYTLSGGRYFQEMKEKGLYTLDIEVVEERVKRMGLTNIYEEKLL